MSTSINTLAREPKMTTRVLSDMMSMMMDKAVMIESRETWEWSGGMNVPRRYVVGKCSHIDLSCGAVC